MKYLLDTNILVSAALFPQGTAARAYELALTDSVDAVVCDYTVDELRRVFQRKFPKRLDVLDIFLDRLSAGITIVPTPIETCSTATMSQIRDPQDWPILRAAMSASADAIVTGDKDFIESGLTRPRMITPAGFIAEALA